MTRKKNILRAARLIPVLLSAVGLATTSIGAGSKNQSDSTQNELAPGKKLIVNVDDLAGIAHIESDFIRENLLQSAFYGAADDREWLGDYHFRYNYNVPKDRGGYLEFNVVDWERSASNFYECTLTARYRTLDRKTLNLGTFVGTKSGISVVTGWEVGDAFEEAAQEAFDQALEALAEKRSLS